MVDVINIAIEENNPILEEAVFEAVRSNKGLLARWFPNFFLDGALVPLNPKRWPAFIAGSFAEGSKIPNFGDRLSTPADNLQVAGEYLESSRSSEEYKFRFWKVV